LIGPPIFYLQSEAHKSGGYRTNDSKRSHKWVLWVAASAATSKPMNNWALAPEARSALRLWGGWAAGPSSHFFFYLTAPIEERTALLQSTGSFRNEGAPRVGVTRGGLYLTVTIDPVRAGGPGSLLFFPLDGIHRGEDATVAIHLTVKKRGVPHASGLRVGVCILPSQSIPSADTNCEQPDQKPHT